MLYFNIIKPSVFISFDKAKISYRYIRGTKNTCLIFVHGLGGDQTAWNKEVNYFHDLGFSTLTLDLRGHGLSSRSRHVSFYSFENMAKDIELLAAKKGIDRAVLIGHCLGGMVSIRLAASSPSFLKKLVLVDTNFKPPFVGGSGVSTTLIRHLLTVFTAFLPQFHLEGHIDFDRFIGTHDLDAKRLLSDMFHTSLKSYFLICKNLVGYNAQSLLKHIHIPTLVIGGSNDSIFPPDVAKSLASGLKKSRLEIIDDANHIIVINNPEDLNRSIRKFIGRLQ